MKAEVRLVFSRKTVSNEVRYIIHIYGGSMAANERKKLSTEVTAGGGTHLKVGCYKRNKKR